MAERPVGQNGAAEEIRAPRGSGWRTFVFPLCGFAATRVHTQGVGSYRVRFLLVPGAGA
jgi:hypothetical protein